MANLGSIGLTLDGVSSAGSIPVQPIKYTQLSIGSLSGTAAFTGFGLWAVPPLGGIPVNINALYIPPAVTAPQTPIPTVAVGQLGRVQALLPRWFADSNPIRDAVLSGIAYAQGYVLGLINFAKLQTRIKTATDGWLDLISADFFGGTLVRKVNETDTAYRARILINMFRERGTRKALVSVLTDLTGIAPTVFEPNRPADTGGLGINTYLGVSRLGSLAMPYQCFVNVHRSTTYISGLGVAGLGAPKFGLGTPYASLQSYDSYQLAVPDSAVYAAIESVKPVGTVVWAQITA